jgi:membrane protein
VSSGSGEAVAFKKSDAGPISGTLAWKEFFLRVYASVTEDRIFSLAAASTYYGLLALFPALAALVAIYGFFANPNSIGEQLASLQGLLPEGGLSVIGNEMKRIASQNQGAQGVAMVVGLVVALWGANSAVKALFDSLNQVYGDQEERGFLKLNAVTLAFTLSAIALLALAIAGIVALPPVIDRLGLSELGSATLKFARWPLLYAVVVLALAFVYRFGPNRRNPKWKWITWGSASAAALWIIASLLFSWYAANFGNFNKTYGSLGAVIAFMVWIWISMIVVLLGAEIDDEIKKASEKG